MIFHKKGYLCKINKNKYEMQDIYIKRGYFIVSQKPDNNEKDDIIKFSNIYINIEQNKCIYNDKVMNKINIMKKNIYNE